MFDSETTLGKVVNMIKIVRRRLAILSIGAGASLLIGSGAFVEAPAGASADPSVENRMELGTAVATRTVNVVSQNVEKKGFGNNYGRPGYGGEAIDKALQQAATSSAEVVLLQEVCEDQYRKLVNDYSSSWTIAWRPIGTAAGLGGCGFRYDDPSYPSGRENYIGDVAIWRGGTSGVTSRYKTGLEPQSEEQVFAGSPPVAVPGEFMPVYHEGMACVSFTKFSTTFRACSTHLPADGTQSTHTSKIKSVTGPWINQDNSVVIVGGDFNALPGSNALDYMYEIGTNGNGRFSEADSLYNGAPAVRGGKDTHFTRCTADRRKIDFIFASINRAPNSSARTMTVTENTKAVADYDCQDNINAVPPTDTPSDRRSDHFLLRGQFSITTNS